MHLGVEDDFRPARKAHPGILVRNIRALADHLQSSGVDVTWDDNFPGHDHFYTFDLLGNRLEFLEPHGRSRASRGLGDATGEATR